MISQTLLFLLDTLLSAVAGAFLLRFYMQLMRAPFRNPAGHFLLALTDFAVKPLRRVLPGLWGWDWASLAAAWTVQYILLFATALLLGTVPAVGNLAGLGVLALVKLAALSVNLLIWTVIVTAVLSWVQPHHWLNSVAAPLVRPFLRPLQRVIPLIGSVDLSPLALILLCQVALMLPIAWLEQLAARLV